MPTLQQRIASGVWGLLLGDALGVPYEFHNPHDLPPRQFIEMTPPVALISRWSAPPRWSTSPGTAA